MCIARTGIECCTFGRRCLHCNQRLLYSTSNKLPTNNEKCEIVWAHVHLEQAKVMYMGAYYRQHNADTESSLHQSIQSLSNSLAEKHLILEGEFNVPDIHWETYKVSPPQMPVPLKHMYNANIPRAEITTFVPSCPPM